MISSEDAFNDRPRAADLAFPEPIVPAIDAADEPAQPLGFVTPEVERRAACFELARKISADEDDVNVYDLVALADWLDRGSDAIHAEPEPCSCNNPPDASHPRGDSAFCRLQAVE